MNDRYEKYKQAIDSGMTYKQIAERFGISQTAVRAYCVRHGLLSKFTAVKRGCEELRDLCSQYHYSYTYARLLRKKKGWSFEEIKEYILLRAKLKELGDDKSGRLETSDV